MVFYLALLRKLRYLELWAVPGRLVEPDIFQAATSWEAFSKFLDTFEDSDLLGGACIEYYDGTPFVTMVPNPHHDISVHVLSGSLETLRVNKQLSLGEIYLLELGQQGRSPCGGFVIR